MAPNHPRTTDSLIAELAKRVERLQNALARGPILPSYTSANLPASPPTGLEVFVSDLGLRAWWNGTAWIYPPQRLDRKLLTATGASITLAVPAGGLFPTLRVAWAGRSDNSSAATYMCLRLNGDSGASSYAWQFNQANGTGQSSDRSPNAVAQIQIGTLAAATATAGYLGSGEFTIPGANGNTFKAVSGHSTSMNAPNGGFSGAYGGHWLNTASVSSVTLFPLNGGLIAGSTATLDGS